MSQHPSSPTFAAYPHPGDHVASTQDLYRRLTSLYGVLQQPQSPDLIYVLDEDFSFLLVSASSLALVGWEPSQMAGHNASNVLHPADVPIFQDFIAGMHAETVDANVGRMAHRFRCRNGSFLPLDCVGSRHRLEDVRYCLSVNEASPRWWSGPANRAVLIIYATVLELQSPLDDNLAAWRAQSWPRAGQNLSSVPNLALQDSSRVAQTSGNSSPNHRSSRASTQDFRDKSTPPSGVEYSTNRQSQPTSAWNSTLLDNYMVASSQSSPTSSAAALKTASPIRRPFLPPSDLSCIEMIEMHTGLVFHDGAFHDDVEPSQSPYATEDESLNRDYRPRPPAQGLSKLAPEIRPHACLQCATSESPEWRRGPDGPKTLCNACGLRWAKQQKQQASSKNADEDAPPQEPAG